MFTRQRFTDLNVDILKLSEELVPVIGNDVGGRSEGQRALGPEVAVGSLVFGVRVEPVP